jgi:hypothetical protein
VLRFFCLLELRFSQLNGIKLEVAELSEGSSLVPVNRV